MRTVSHGRATSTRRLRPSKRNGLMATGFSGWVMISSAARRAWTFESGPARPRTSIGLITKPHKFQLETLVPQAILARSNQSMANRVIKGTKGARRTHEAQDLGAFAVSGGARARLHRGVVVASDRARRPDGQASLRRIPPQPRRRPRRPRAGADRPRRSARIRPDRPRAGARHGAARAAAVGRALAARARGARGAGRAGERRSGRARAANLGRAPRAARRPRAAAEDLPPGQGAERQSLRGALTPGSCANPAR